MRKFFIFYAMTFMFYYGNACTLSDTLQYEIRYSKKEFKKEQKDLKQFAAHRKEINNTIKSGNVDYLNVLLEKSKILVSKEIDESANRISIRSKKMGGHHKRVDSIQVSDIPKAYNPDLVQQQKPAGVTKEETVKMKTEAEILSKYGKIIREQQQIIISLNKLNTIDAKNLSEISAEWVAKLSSFYDLMQQELSIMKRETGKKNKK